MADYDQITPEYQALLQAIAGGGLKAPPPPNNSPYGGAGWGSSLNSIASAIKLKQLEGIRQQQIPQRYPVAGDNTQPAQPQQSSAGGGFVGSVLRAIGGNQNPAANNGVGGNQNNGGNGN